MNPQTEIEAIDKVIQFPARTLRLIRCEWPSIDEDEAPLRAREIQKKLEAKAEISLLNIDDDDFDPAA